MSEKQRRPVFAGCAASNLGLSNKLLRVNRYFIELSDSVRGQERLRSDCSNTQADLGFRCTYMLKETFSRVAVLMTLRTAKFQIPLNSRSLTLTITTFHSNNYWPLVEKECQDQTAWIVRGSECSFLHLT